ncbi:MAG: HAD hydrolase-like protein [Phycisphaerales bacterium]|nr:HAD hydrolase-like protein [Phycisphaerales bacterium]
MKQYDLILFDLDHTLTDPSEEMLASARYALAQFGVTEVPPAILERFLDTPLLAVFEQECGMTLDQSNQAFQHYWYYAGSMGLPKNRPYDGVKEMLAELVADGRELAICTARPVSMAEKIVKAVGINQYFTHIYGTCEDSQRQNKKLVIFDALMHYPDLAPERVVMVGDRTADILGAKDNGVDSLAVVFGSETAEQLARVKPTYLVDTVADMADILLLRQP